MRRLLALIIATTLLLFASVVPVAARAQTVDMEIVLTAVTVEPSTGILTVSGTVTCEEPIGGASGWIDVYQRTGHGELVYGFVLFFGECAGTEEFTFSITPESGRFQPGRVRVVAHIEACDDIDRETGECGRVALDELRRVLVATSG
ncbi:MAG: hypothetical protein M3295_04980 [Chloroflexota bacterium]|nr:hypothetical protein [Chloroflexota bacterium]